MHLIKPKKRRSDVTLYTLIRITMNDARREGKDAFTELARVFRPIIRPSRLEALLTSMTKAKPWQSN